MSLISILSLIPIPLPIHVPPFKGARGIEQEGKRAES